MVLPIGKRITMTPNGDGSWVVEFERATHRSASGWVSDSKEESEVRKILPHLEIGFTTLSKLDRWGEYLEYLRPFSAPEGPSESWEFRVRQED